MINWIILFECLLVFIITIICLIKIPKNYFLKNYFVLMNFIITIWLLVNFIFRYYHSFLGYRAAYAFGAIMLASSMVIIIAFSEQKKLSHLKISLIYLLGFTFFILSFVDKVFFTLYPGKNFEDSYTPYFYIYAIYLLSALVYMLIKSFSSIRKLKGLIKLQIKYIFFGILSFGFFAFFMSFLAPLLFGDPNFAIFDTLGALLLVGFTSYAIVKHNLMEIDIAWRHWIKSIIFFILLLCVTFGIGANFAKHDTLMGTIFSILLVNLCYFKPKIDIFFYNIFLKKYKKIWDELQEAGNIKNNIYETNTIIDILTTDVPNALQLSQATYYRLEESTQKYIVHETTQKYQPSDILFNDKLDNKLVETLISKRSCLYIHDFDDPELVALFLQMEIELCYPIFYQDLLTGILVYGKKKNNTIFNQEDLKLLAETVEKSERQMGVINKMKHMSINSAAEILEKYKNTNQKMLLNETKRLSEIREINMLCEHSKRVVNRLLNVRDVEIYLYDRENKKKYVSSSETKPLKVSEENYLVKYLIQSNDIVSIMDLKKWTIESKSKDFQEAVDMAEKLNAKFVIPLTDKKLLGFLVIDGKMDNLEYSQDDFIFLSVIKNTLEITLRNIYLNEKSQIDPLTKTYNRNFLESRLEEEIIQGFRECVPVSFLMIDGDYFKWFNDNKGHDAGDKVLIAMTNCIKSTIRPTDELCRFGGEEFVVICTGTNNNGAVLLADRINQEFKKNQKILELSELYERKISVSIGVSTFQNKEPRTQYTNQEILDYCEALIKKSDKAMYLAKDAGRDTFRNGGEFENI